MHWYCAYGSAPPSNVFHTSSCRVKKHFTPLGSAERAVHTKDDGVYLWLVTPTDIKEQHVGSEVCVCVGGGVTRSPGACLYQTWNVLFLAQILGQNSVAVLYVMALHNYSFLVLQCALVPGWSTSQEVPFYSHNPEVSVDRDGTESLFCHK